jgi:hypothetical protein
MARLERLLQAEGPSNEIAAAWAVKERPRMLLCETEPDRINRRLIDFYNAAADAHLDEATRLAGTNETWWPSSQQSRAVQWRWRWDLNPRWAVNPHTLSRRAP